MRRRQRSSSLWRSSPGSPAAPAPAPATPTPSAPAPASHWEEQDNERVRKQEPHYKSGAPWFNLITHPETLTLQRMLMEHNSFPWWRNSEAFQILTPFPLKKGFNHLNCSTCPKSNLRSQIHSVSHSPLTSSAEPEDLLISIQISSQMFQFC